MADGSIPSYTAISELETNSASGRPTAPARLTLSDLWRLGCLYLSFCIACAVATTVGPFYPTLATIKGLSPSETGFVLGLYRFIGIFVSPLAGKLLSRISTKYVMNGSCLLVGLFAILLGFLQWSPSGVIFLILSIAVLSGIGTGIVGVLTVIYAFVATAYPSRLATFNGGLSFVDAAGSSVAPLLGGYLQEAGGFITPFATFGGIMLLMCIVILICFPKTRATVDDETTTVGMFEPLKHIAVCLQLFLLFSTGFLHSFNGATLTFHLQQVSPGITAGTIGFIFFTYNVCGAIAAPVAGIVMDRIKRVYIPLLVGVISFGIGFACCGPVWPLTVEPSIYSVAFAQVFIGIGYRVLDCSTKYLTFRELYATGCPNSKATNATVSGIINTVNPLGTTLGSVLGGVLFDQLGYAKASAVIVTYTVIILTLTLAFALKRRNLCVKDHGLAEI